MSNSAPDESAPAIEPNPKWIRGTVAGHTVIDTRSSLYVWEVPYYPTWYVPTGHVTGELVPNGVTFKSPQWGEALRYDLMLSDGTRSVDVACRHPDSPVVELRDLVRFEWDAMDSWFEEDLEVHVHPRSPYVRVDAIPSSRHVRVSVGGQVVADSARPVVLFETGLPQRYYLPKTDVRMDLLTPTGTTSACPYKGWASYWSVTIGGTTHEDLAWGYRTTLPDAAGVAGMVCFYDEKVDVELDGEPQDRPRTKFV